MGGDSYSRGCGFESLDGHLFTLLNKVKCLFENTKIDGK